MSKYNPIQTQEIQELGAYLRQQRLDQSLTLEQIASSTFIRLSLLKALEQGDVDQLPERVYVQGFIRRYGDALNLDGYALSHEISPPQEEELPPEIPPDLVAVPPMESMGEDLSSASVRDQKKAHKKAASTSRNLTAVTDEEEPSLSSGAFSPKAKIYGLYVLVLGGAVAGLFYLFSRSQTPEPSSQNQPEEQSVQVKKQATKEAKKPISKEPQIETKKVVSSQKPSSILEPIPPESNSVQSVETRGQQAPETAQTEVNRSVNSLETANVDNTTPETSETSESAPNPSESVTESPNNTTPDVDQPTTSATVDPNSPLAASVALEADSWMRVQVDGKTEYEGILEKGSQQTWMAKETLIIRAGNAGAVKLVVNNQPGQKLGNLGEVKEVTLTRDD